MSGRVLGEYLELTKPRITLFILMSAAIGFLCAEHLVGSFSWLVLFHALMGTALLASGTAALNQWYEREGDGKMRRTRQRPIPSGRMTPKAAFEFGLVLSIFGFLELWLGANLLTAMLGVFTEFTYLFLYTPLKKISPHSTTIGAIPGAMPPLIGYAAASGLLNWEAGVLYAILFLWQFPHFYAIAWMYREDYAKAGILMLPVVEPSNESTARRIVWCSLVLIPISLLPKYFDMVGHYYVYGAVAVGLYYFYAGVRASYDRTVPRARQVLLASVVYLPVLYGLLAFDGIRY